MTYKNGFESQNFAIFDNFYSTESKLKNFLRGWLLILGLYEGLVECATVCVKSEVILMWVGAERGEREKLISLVHFSGVIHNSSHQNSRKRIYE